MCGAVQREVGARSVGSEQRCGVPSAARSTVNRIGWLSSDPRAPVSRPAAS